MIEFLKRIGLSITLSDADIAEDKFDKLVDKATDSTDLL
jgi:alcohol dehydrogenase class IV